MPIETTEHFTFYIFTFFLIYSDLYSGVRFNMFRVINPILKSNDQLRQLIIFRNLFVLIIVNERLPTYQLTLSSLADPPPPLPPQFPSMLCVLCVFFLFCAPAREISSCWFDYLMCFKVLSTVFYLKEVLMS